MLIRFPVCSIRVVFHHLNIYSLSIPDPATPTVAAPAPMYLAAESMSMARALVWKLLTRLGAPHEAVNGDESPW